MGGGGGGGGGGGAGRRGLCCFFLGRRVWRSGSWVHGGDLEGSTPAKDFHACTSDSSTILHFNSIKLLGFSTSWVYAIIDYFFNTVKAA